MASAGVVVFSTHGHDESQPQSCKNEAKGLFLTYREVYPAPAPTSSEPDVPLVCTIETHRSHPRLSTQPWLLVAVYPTEADAVEQWLYGVKHLGADPEPANRSWRQTTARSTQRMYTACSSARWDRPLLLAATHRDHRRGGLSFDELRLGVQRHVVFRLHPKHMPARRRPRHAAAPGVVSSAGTGSTNARRRLLRQRIATGRICCSRRISAGGALPGG